MLNINGELWSIFFVKPNDPKLMRSDGSYTLGCCDNNDKAIYIHENLSDFMLKKVLCHELTHAAMYSYNIVLTLEQEELIADLIATYGEEIIDITNKVFTKLKWERY